MSLEDLTFTETSNFPIRNTEVHNGKVRSVYWLTKEDSQRIIGKRGYSIHPDSLLGVMIISDRISSFDVIWRGEQGLKGVPEKGASLNAISYYWFKKFKENNLAGNHILEVPHPLVWIVQRAETIKSEAIARQYITGSMWRAYESGERIFCGIRLPENLKKDQRLNELLITPSTKGILKGIQGIPEKEDVNLTREQISKNYKRFGFKSLNDVFLYEILLKEGFRTIMGSEELKKIKKLLVDTKFEFGYVLDLNGRPTMVYIDEVGTPDSSRLWNEEEYKKGRVVEDSKEILRQYLLGRFDEDILLDKDKMNKRKELAGNNLISVEVMFLISKKYKGIAQGITGSEIPHIENPRQSIIDALKSYGIIED